MSVPFRAALLPLALVALAVLTRASVLGDLAYFNDESFYWLAARRMHQGQWLYAEVWDRKGPALFATWYVAVPFGSGLAAARGLALAFAVATALALARLARAMAGEPAGWAAGCLYLAALPMFVGAGGQPQVFYNLWMALAVLIVRDGADRGDRTVRLHLAMALAGLALAYKQTAICEAVFLGLWTLWRRRRLGMGLPALARLALTLMAAGATPLLACAAVFAIGGHFDALWHAMVTSNLVKTYDPWGDHWSRARALATAAAPLLALALPGLALGPTAASASRPRDHLLVAGWCLAALAGVAVIPNLYADYMLPLIAPLAVAAGCAAARRPLGPVLAVLVGAIYLAASPALEFTARRAASAEVTETARRIAARIPHPRLLVYEGPASLYGLVGREPPGPLLHPFHLNFAFEADTAPVDTAAQMRAILAWRPQVVVAYTHYDPRNENPKTAALLRDYLRRCRPWFDARYHEIAADQPYRVWGDCAVR
jgi:hypothetical protein